MEKRILRRLEASSVIPEEDKQKIKKLLSVSDRVQFGQITPRLEGYMLDDFKGPRCTAVLQMDGSKAGALMEWSKRQVSSRIETILTERLTRSSVLSFADIQDACAQGLVEPDKQKDEAAVVGTGEHDNVEHWLWGEKYKETPGLLMFIEAWKKTGYELVATEIPVCWHDGNGHGFGGRIDILAYKEGKFYIGDNKTSRSIHDSYGCQVAAYKAAVEQMSDIKIEGGTIFHIPNIDNLNDRQKKEFKKRGSLVQLKNLEEAFEHYRLLLGLYYKRNNRYF